MRNLGIRSACWHPRAGPVFWAPTSRPPGLLPGPSEISVLGPAGCRSDGGGRWPPATLLLPLWGLRAGKCCGLGRSTAAPSTGPAGSVHAGGGWGTSEQTERPRDTRRDSWRSRQTDGHRGLALSPPILGQAQPHPPASASLLGGQVDSRGCSHLYYGGRRGGDKL